MKTPEKIKKGLECRARAYCGTCTYECGSCDVYVNGRFSEIFREAVDFIQQLESRLAQVERERDAMHRDMKLYSRCKACKKFADGQDCPVHTECTYGGKALFEWRGVCEENTKEEEK